MISWPFRVMHHQKRNESSLAYINTPKKYRFNPLSLDTANSNSKGSLYYDTSTTPLQIPNMTS